MSRHKKSSGALYILLPFAIAGLYLLFCLTAGADFGAYGLQKWRAMIIQGAPDYEYEQLAELYRPDSVSGSVKSPVKGEQYGKIICDSIGLKTPLYYGDSAEILEKGAGTYMGGGLPGEEETVLIGAHDTTFFAPLEQIKENDIFEISTVYGDFQYKVTGVRTGDMADQSMYEWKPDGEEIILYTCYPFGAVNEVRSQRYYVYAKRTDASKSSGD